MCCGVASGGKLDWDLETFSSNILFVTEDNVLVEIFCYLLAYDDSYLSINGDASSSSKIKTEIYSTADQLLWYSGILKSLE